MASSSRFGKSLGLLVGGGAFFAVAVGAAVWGLPLVSELRDAPVAERAVDAPAGDRGGEMDPRWRLTQLLTPTGTNAVLPFRPGFEPPRDSAFTLHGVRYDDPTGGSVPLEWVADDRDLWLTPGFRLRDFTARDGAPLARISPELVAGLERMRHRAGQLIIISGYRHPAHNAVVGGAGDSQHQAGKAADIASPGKSPTELALLALDEIGCNVGLGLGPNSLHVDVRGELKTWTYAGASMSGPAFATWVHTLCGIPVPDGLAQRAAALWLEEPPDDYEAPPPNQSMIAPRTDLLSRHEEAIIATARNAYDRSGAGAVVVDLRRGAGGTSPRYVVAGDPSLRELQLDGLVGFCLERQDLGYFAYAILSDTAEPLTGVMSLALLGPLRSSAPAPSARPSPASGAAPAPAMPAPAAPAPAAQPRAGGGDHPTADQWGIVLASVPDASGGEQVLREQQLRMEGVPLKVVSSDGRQRVIVGPFNSRAAAQDAMRGLSDRLPQDAWLVEL